MIDHLRRQLAPLSDRAWAAIDAEAARSARHFLAGRPLVDVDGPLGWEHSAEARGRVTPVRHALGEGVVATMRAVQPMIEMRTPFRVGFEVLDALDRGAPDADLASVQEAARLAALAEDQLVFGGNEEAGLAGMVTASPHPAIPIPKSYDDYPGAVARAVALLRKVGVEGPFAIALGPRCYTGVVETAEHGGYPVLEHMKLILGGPVIWAPAVDGAVVVSRRGGDHRLVLGQDLTVGYAGTADGAVELFLEESITFVVADDRAAVPLVHGA